MPMEKTVRYGRAGFSCRVLGRMSSFPIFQCLRRAVRCSRTLCLKCRVFSNFLTQGDTGSEQVTRNPVFRELGDGPRTAICPDS